MWTGRQTLERIESAIVSLHRQESELDGALASATAEAERMRRERADAFRELARIKLDEITARRLVDHLDAAEARAVRLLHSRRQQLEQAAAERQQAVGEMEQAEKRRSAAAATLEAALNDLDALRGKVEGEVRASGKWADTKAAADASDAIAAAAEEKAASSEAELSRKRKPYDDDPLFSYLWARAYLTPAYRAGLLARFLDRVTARFVGFADARANYAMLSEIPARLREHAKLQRALAEERHASLATIEREALVAAGVEDKERAVERARQTLATADADLEKRQALLRSIDQKRNESAAARDDAAYSEALQTIAGADAQDEFATLVAEARRTATTADDAMVRRIGDINGKLERVDREIADLRNSARSVAERRAEVERARDRFRQAGYDHPNATFGNENELGRILGQILEGVVRSGVIWDILRGGFGVRYPRGRPDFGGPTYPFPFPFPGGNGTRGGEWRKPEARGSWSPTGGGEEDDRGSDMSDRGEFRTGGSF